MKIIVLFLQVGLFQNVCSFPTWLTSLQDELAKILNTKINGTQCASDLQFLLEALKTQEAWALNMLDANSKLAPGLLRGNRHGHGNYDQCLAVQKHPIMGKYCTAYLTPKNAIRKEFIKLASNKKIKLEIFEKHIFLYVGVCVPHSCGTDELEMLVRDLNAAAWIPFKISFAEERCFDKSKPLVTLSRFDWGVYFFFLGFLVLLLVSTGYDLLTHQANLLVSFSLYSNTKQLFSLRANRTLSCLDGIRALSIIWILLGHTLYTQVETAVNLSYFEAEWSSSWFSFFLVAAHYGVDTFFTLSGFLVIYVSLQHPNHTLFRFFSYRILRLSPALLAVILVNTSVIKLFVDGPVVFKILEDSETRCKTNWWTTLSFLNNFVRPEARCLSHSWYLSVDFQFYLIAPIYLYFLGANCKKAVLGAFLVIIGSVIYTWRKVVEKNLGFLLLWELTTEELSAVYISSWSRIAPWLIGATFGYYIQNKIFFLESVSKKMLSGIALSAICWLIYSQKYFLSGKHDIYQSAFFNSISRSIWSLAICLLIYICLTEKEGLINIFLSNPVFEILAKLSYSIYLVHVTILNFITTNRRQIGWFSNFNLFFEFWGFLVFTLFGSVIMYLMFEAPFVSILTYLKNKNKMKKL